MEQQTPPNQQTNVERAALFPPEEKPALTTSDVIIIGEDMAKAGSAEVASSPEQTEARLEVATVEQMFDSFYDSYVAFANEPSETYVYHLPKNHRFDTEVHTELNRAEVAEQKRQELIKYARVAFINGDIHIQPHNVPTKAPVSVDTIAEALVADGILRAQVRYSEVREGFDATSQPGHVGVEQSDETPEDKASFIELVKSFGARAFHSLSLHSGEVTLPPTRTLPTVPIQHVEVAERQ